MILKRVLVVFCLFFICFNLNSQSVFTYNAKKDIVIGTMAGIIFGVPFFLNNEPENIPTGLNKDNINGFDRTFMFSYNKPLDITSDIIVYGLLALPIFSLSGNFRNKDAWLTYGIMYTESVLLVYGTCETLKKSIVRYRPYCYSGDIPSGLENDYYKSFPSRHTVFAFMSAGFLTATFFAEHPESSWKIPIMIGSYALASGVAAFRISSGVHFLTDVLAGASIGSLYGWIIPMLHKKQGSENNMAIHFVGNGIIATLKIF